MRNLLFVLVTLLHTASAQEAWMSHADFPGIGRDDATAAVSSGRVFFGTGFGTGFIYLNDWWEYNPQTDSWTSRTALPDEPRQYAACTSDEDAVYLFGGLTPSGCTDEIWKYTVLNDSWELLTNFPNGGRQAPVLVKYGYYLYAGLGRCSGVYYSDWLRFDLRSLTWEALTSFPGEPRFDPIFGNVNHEVFLSGGLGDGIGFSDTYVYRYHYDDWIQKDDFTGCSRMYTAHATTDNKIYFVNGGDANYDFCHEAYSFETGVFGEEWNSWTILPTDKVKRGGSSFIYDDRFYYICGIDSSYNRLNNVQSVRISTNENDQIEMNVYPNPAIDFLTVEFSSPIDSKNQIDIFDLSGRILVSKKYHDESSSIVLNLLTLRAGIYFLILRNSDGQILEQTKIVKQ